MGLKIEVAETRCARRGKGSCSVEDQRRAREVGAPGVRGRGSGEAKGTEVVADEGTGAAPARGNGGTLTRTAKNREGEIENRAEDSAKPSTTRHSCIWKLEPNDLEQKHN